MLKNKVFRWVVIIVLMAWVIFLSVLGGSFNSFVQVLLVFSGNMVFGVAMLLLAAKDHDWWIFIISLLWLVVPEDIIGVWNTVVSVSFFNITSCFFPIAISVLLYSRGES